MTTGIHAWSAVGLTHASSVIPFVRSSELASGTVTRLLVPSKATAAPYLPVADHVAVALSEPALPLPEESAAAVPVPSPKEYAATSPLGGGGGGGGGGG